MSEDFKEFLRREAEKRQGEAKANEGLVEEWRAAVERLFQQIRAWLKQSDPNGVIEIKEGEHVITETGLGRYRVPRLDLDFFGKWIGIIPKARGRVATASPPRKSAPGRAIGRVDITDELIRYVLYRFQEDEGEVWLVDDLNLPPKPLTQEVFEKAIMSYLL
jgi:hypothetical protein